MAAQRICRSYFVPKIHVLRPLVTALAGDIYTKWKKDVEEEAETMGEQEKDRMYQRRCNTSEYLPSVNQFAMDEGRLHLLKYVILSHKM